MTIDELVQVSYNQAKEMGWCEREVPIPEMIALIHSEASEALESYRNDEPIYWTKDGKPEGILSEFADILIRIGHYTHLLRINQFMSENLPNSLEEVVKAKLAYNLTRGHRHGGKLA